MTTMTLDQAKDHLADLLAKAADGEEVVIVRDDGSAFTVVPTQSTPRKKRGLVGSPQEETWMPDDADTTNGESDSYAAPIQRRPRRESYGVLKGKIWMAPDFDDIPEGFERYLGGNSSTTSNNDDGPQAGESKPPTLKDRSELFGILKGKIWIAPDFDDIPEGFEPYLGNDYEKGE